MLPAWATVALSLGSALIGAAAGTLGAWFGLRGATLDIAYREREATRNRLLDAAEGFSRAWADAHGRLGDRTSDLASLRSTWREDERAVVARGLVISLLLGTNSSAHSAASGARAELSHYADLILDYREAQARGDTSAKEIRARAIAALRRSGACHDSFLDAAHSELDKLAPPPLDRSQRASG